MSEPFVVAFVLGVTPGKWAGIWAERMPRTPLELRPLSPEEALSAVVAGTVDAAFIRLPVEGEDLGVIPLYEERPVVVMPKEHVLSVLDEVSAQDLDGETVLEGDPAADIELVAAGVGVTIVPESIARALSRRDVVARPATDAPTTRVALVWRTDSATTLTEEFIGIVRGRTANSSRGATPDPVTPSSKVAPKSRPAPRKKPPQPRRPRRR